MLTTGCKIWLWILLVGQSLGFISNLISFDIILLVVEIVLLYGIVLLLFKFKKIGFYYYVIGSIIYFIYMLSYGSDFISALLLSLVSPAILYCFISKNTDVIK